MNRGVEREFTDLILRLDFDAQLMKLAVHGTDFHAVVSSQVEKMGYNVFAFDAVYCDLGIGPQRP